MSAPLRIATFVGSFPVVSETFILRQIAGLLDLGHRVNIFADVRADSGGPIQPEVGQYRLLERTTFMDMPPETAPWEMPVWPLTGRTWPPGAAAPVHNARRVALAIEKFLRCLASSPRLAFRVLDPREYGYQTASLSALHRLAKLSAEPRRFDVLHAHFGPVGNSFRFAKELWRAPLVVSFHGYDYCTVPRKEGTGVYQRLFRTADIVTVNSEYTRGRVEQLGCPPTKLHKLPMGLNLGDFVFRERMLKAGEPIRILTVARLVEIKGHDGAIRAVARLRERHPDLRYDIVGDGPLRKQLEQLVIKLGLRDAVTIHGAQNGVFIRQLMDQAHLALLASVTVESDQEGQGLVLQEAQAAGLPVVATQHGALPEGMMPGRSGLLVPERDVEALAEALSYLIEHPELWPAMGQEGRKFVEEHFDARKLSQQLAELLGKAASDYRKGAS